MLKSPSSSRDTIYGADCAMAASTRILATIAVISSLLIPKLCAL